MTIAIIGNTLILSLDKYPVDLETNYVVEKLNIMFTFLFIFELILKIVAMGPKAYYKGNYFHIFDTLIVLASAADVIIGQVLNAMNDGQVLYKGSAITALRGIRIMRVFKLSR
jgi:hypothetical protein